jgi:hypothetical protein
MADIPPTPEKSEPVEEIKPSPEVEEIEPANIIPLEAARAHLRHWWREPVTGLIATGIGVFDSWFYGHEQGLSSSLDELLVIGGIVLMAGSKRLFGGAPSLIEHRENNNKVPSK